MKALTSGWWPDEGKAYQTVAVRGIPGITAKVYKSVNAKGYTSFVLTYSLLGKRKIETFNDPAKAVAAGETAISKIANGEQAVLELTNTAKDIYMRAEGYLKPLGVPLDVAAQEYAAMRGILNGAGSPIEAARFFAKSHAKELPRITVPKAVEECLTHCRADGKSDARMHQLEFYLNEFAGCQNIDVSELTPGLISRYLTAMQASERTKKNARDVLGYFGRWLVLHGYLERGTDLVEGVQKYSMKPGKILIYTPEEIAGLLKHADKRLAPYLAIGAFAGLRQAEIMRLDWAEVGEEFIEVTAEKAKTKVRRLIPIKPNLAAWFKGLRQKSGRVCAFGNVVNQLMKLSKAAKVPWKKNALRHSYISYRVAECADVARVAEESGNSAAIIRSNYLERVKPAQATEWFSIKPGKGTRKTKSECIAHDIHSPYDQLKKD